MSGHTIAMRSAIVPGMKLSFPQSANRLSAVRERSIHYLYPLCMTSTMRD